MKAQLNFSVQEEAQIRTNGTNGLKLWLIDLLLSLSMNAEITER